MVKAIGLLTPRLGAEDKTLGGEIAGLARPSLCSFCAASCSACATPDQRAPSSARRSPSARGFPVWLARVRAPQSPAMSNMPVKIASTWISSTSLRVLYDEAN